MRGRFGPLLFTFVMLGAALYPLSWEPGHDSFPLSSYPMFSHGRPDPMFTMSHAVGILEDGTRVPLEPMVSAGNREVLQSMRTIEMGIAQNAPAFCQEVAARVALARPEEGAIRSVELCRETWDTVAYFSEDQTEGQARHVFAVCDVSEASP